MRAAPFLCALALGLGAAGGSAAGPDSATTGIAPGELRSGYYFLRAETQALQDDEFSNPGNLWVREGEQLWNTPAGTKNRACAGCHGAPAQQMRGVAARYPRYAPEARQLINLEQRINLCRVGAQGAPALPYESRELLALTTLVASQSRGLPQQVAIDGPARPFFEAGRELFHRRLGQLHLSCAQCHDQLWGRRLRSEPISQGHGNAYPAYRLEWQDLGSLHRRFRSCNVGVRAEPFAPGSPEYVNLELYLAWRAAGLPIETPGVRR